MKIIHKDGFSKDELLNIRSIIYSNTIGSIRVLVEATQKLGIPISAENQVTHQICESRVLLRIGLC